MAHAKAQAAAGPPDDKWNTDLLQQTSDEEEQRPQDVVDSLFSFIYDEENKHDDGLSDTEDSVEVPHNGGTQQPQDMVDSLFSFIYDEDLYDDGFSDPDDSVEVPHNDSWPQDKEEEHIYQNLSELDTNRKDGTPVYDEEPQCKKPRFSCLDTGVLGQSVDSGVLSNISCEPLCPSSPNNKTSHGKDSQNDLQEVVKVGNGTSIVRVASVCGTGSNGGSDNSGGGGGDGGGVRVTTTSNVYVNPHAAPLTTTSIYLHADPVISMDTHIGTPDNIDMFSPVDSANTFNNNGDLPLCPPTVGSPSLTITINQNTHVTALPENKAGPFVDQEVGCKTDSAVVQEIGCRKESVVVQEVGCKMDPVVAQLEEFNAKFPSFEECIDDVDDDIAEPETGLSGVNSLGQCNRDQPILDIVAIQCEFVDEIDLDKENRSEHNDILENTSASKTKSSEIGCSGIKPCKSDSEREVSGEVIVSPRKGDMEEEEAVSWQFVPCVVSDRYNQRQRRPASGPQAAGDNGSQLVVAPVQVVPDIDSSNGQQRNDTGPATSGRDVFDGFDAVDNNEATSGSSADAIKRAESQESEYNATLDGSLSVKDLVRDSSSLVQAFNARFPSDPTRVTHNPIYKSCDTISPLEPVFTSCDVITLDTYDPKRSTESNTDDDIIADPTLSRDNYASPMSLSPNSGDTGGAYSSVSSTDGRVSASSTEHDSLTDNSRVSSLAFNDDGRSLSPYSSDDGIISGGATSPEPPRGCTSPPCERGASCSAPPSEHGANSTCCETPCTESVCDDCLSCSCDEGISDDDYEDDTSGDGLGAAVSRAVRRSMRRMKRLRLSGRRRSSRRGHRSSPDQERPTSGVSQETEVRRELPPAPEVGLATVRSPATASIMVTSLMAALAPSSSLEAPISPRETLTTPQDINTTNRSQESSNVRSGRSGRRRRSHQRSSRNRGGAHQDPSTANPLGTGPGDPSNGPLSLDSYYSGSSGPLSTSTPMHTSLPSSPIPPASPTRLSEDEGPWAADGSFIPRSLLNTSVAPSSSSSSSSTSPTTTTTSNTGQPPPSTVSQASLLPTSQQLSTGRQNNSSEATTGRPNSSQDRDSASPTARGTGSTTTTTGRSGGPRPPTTSSHSRDRRRHRRRDDGSSQANDRNNNTQAAAPTTTTGGDNTTNSDTTSPPTTTTTNTTTRTAPRPPPNRSNRRNMSNGGLGHVTLESERAHVQGGTWDHSHSALMASLAVTVTTFNISRFAILGAHFGWCFIVQWVLVSIVLGLPLMTFHVTVGKYLGAGVIDMWRISPIFQGVGFSVVIAQALLGVYCCVPTAWLFVYFRDSFITHNNRFRWADCQLVDCTAANASKETLVIEGVPSYFNTKVLQRNETNDWMQELGSLKFDLAFNIALIWIITLIALSKGNQSYGKVCYIVFLLPLLCYLVVCVYLTSWTDDLYINKTNSSFMDPMCWMSASREVFLVWGLHGAVLQQMAAHNRKNHSLYRDTTVLTIITMLVLILAAVMGSSCLAGIIDFDLYPKPSSFENTETAQFLSKTNQAFHPGFGSDINQIERKIYPVPEYSAIPTYSVAYDNFYTGIRIRPLKTREQDLMGDRREPGVSGYQSIRVATELFPALLAINTARQISPFWSSLFYLSLLLFGIAQQLAVWRTVVEAVIRINHERLQPWETFITFLCCLFGFSAALPMATGAGIHILYFWTML
ncbi:unnamed protein product [Meganyctiphanes norvegica]|uniref:Uncharacterized protein n=1 Tax=Meganyctiphanes norvegica TaxID=48144 RepID=A0AAV2QGY8_MEGNR